LYNVSRLVNGQDIFELKMEKTSKDETSENIRFSLKGNLWNEPGFVRGLSPIPSTSSVVVSLIEKDTS
jgi:hypothetical protein